MAVLCPECENPIDIADEVDEGETVQCEECGIELEVVSTDPVELVAVEEEGYEDEEVTHISDEDED